MAVSREGRVVCPVIIRHVLYTLLSLFNVSAVLQRKLLFLFFFFFCVSYLRFSIALELFSFSTFSLRLFLFFSFNFFK